MVTALFGSARTFHIEGSEFLLTPLLIFLLFGFIVVIPAVFFRRWYFYRRRLKKRVITAEYVPPLELRPAEIGYLFDGKLREREVAGTIIDLIQRGFLHMRKTGQGKRIFSGPRIDPELKSYEKKLIEEADVPEGIEALHLLKRFTSLKTKELGMVAASKSFVFTQLVHSDLQRKQFVKNGAVKAFLFGSFRMTLLLQAALIYVPLLGVWTISVFLNGSSDFKVLGLVLLTAITACFVFIVPFICAAMLLHTLRGRIIGRDWIITDKLERLWPQIVGYRQYVQLVENDKLEFQTDELKKISKNDTLPYAVALGFVKNWRDLLS